MRTIFLAGLLLGVSLSAIAQDFANDLKVSNSLFSQTKSIKVDVEYLLFPSHKSQKVEEKSAGSFCKNGRKFYSQVSGVLTLQDENYQLMIDKEEQSVIVYAIDTNFIPKFTDFTFEDVITWYESIDYELKEKEKIYYITFKPGSPAEYEKMTVSFDLNEHHLNKIIFYLQEVNRDEWEAEPYKPRIEIIFTNYQLNPKLPDSLFSTSSYIKLNNGKIRLQEKFAGYELINTIM